MRGSNQVVAPLAAVITQMACLAYSEAANVIEDARLFGTHLLGCRLAGVGKPKLF